jgi:hypothetical protein
MLGNNTTQYFEALILNLSEILNFDTDSSRYDETHCDRILCQISGFQLVGGVPFGGGTTLSQGSLKTVGKHTFWS